MSKKIGSIKESIDKGEILIYSETNKCITLDCSNTNENCSIMLSELEAEQLIKLIQKALKENIV